MAELPFRILFEAVDRATATIKKVGTAMQQTTEQAEAAAAASKAMREHGETMVKAGLAMGGAGVAVLYGLHKLVEPAIEAQGEMAHLATAMQDGKLQAQHLAEAEEFVNKTAREGVISTGNLREAFYMARSQGLDQATALQAVAAAQDLVTGTTKNAVDANEAMVATTRTLTGVSNIYHEDLHKVADTLSLLQTKYAFQNITEITKALHFVAPVAQYAHVGITQMSGALAILSENMIQSGEAGSAFRNVLVQFLKGGSKEMLVPFRKTDIHGNFLFQQSLESLLASLSKLGPAAQSAFLIHAGFAARAITAIGILLKNHQKLIDVQKDLDHATGAAHANFLTRVQGADEQIAILGNAWEVLKETLGSLILPDFTGWIKGLTDIVHRVTDWVNLNPGLAQMALKIAAIGGGVLVLGGLVTAAAGAFLILGSFAGVAGGAVTVALAGLPALIGGVAYASYEVYKHWDSIKHLWAGLKGPSQMDPDAIVAAISQYKNIEAYKAFASAKPPAFLQSIADWGKNLSLSDVIPALHKIGDAYQWVNDKLFAVFGPAGIAKIKGFFEHLQTSIEVATAKLPAMFFDLGVKLIKELGAGILSKLTYLGGPIEAIVGKIASYIPRHSPAEIGPLSTLDRIPFSETLAQSIRVQPIVAAMEPILAAMRITPSAIVSPPPMIAPFADRATGEGKSASSAHSIMLTVNYSPTINGATPADFDPQKHGRHIARIIKDELTRSGRLSYE